MRSDRQPDDVCFARLNLGAICEDCPAVRGPRHLEAPRHAADTFDSQAGAKFAPAQVFNEISNYSSESGSPRVRHLAVRLEKSLGYFEGGQLVRYKDLRKSSPDSNRSDRPCSMSESESRS